MNAESILSQKTAIIYPLPASQSGEQPMPFPQQNDFRYMLPRSAGTYVASILANPSKVNGLQERLSESTLGPLLTDQIGPAGIPVTVEAIKIVTKALEGISQQERSTMAAEFTFGPLPATAGKLVRDQLTRQDQSPFGGINFTLYEAIARTRYHFSDKEIADNERKADEYTHLSTMASKFAKDPTTSQRIARIALNLNQNFDQSPSKATQLSLLQEIANNIELYQYVASRNNPRRAPEIHTMTKRPDLVGIGLSKKGEDDPGRTLYENLCLQLKEKVFRSPYGSLKPAGLNRSEYAMLRFISENPDFFKLKIADFKTGWLEGPLDTPMTEVAKKHVRSVMDALIGGAGFALKHFSPNENLEVFINRLADSGFFNGQIIMSQMPLLTILENLPRYEIEGTNNELTPETQAVINGLDDQVAVAKYNIQDLTNCSLNDLVKESLDSLTKDLERRQRDQFIAKLLQARIDKDRNDPTISETICDLRKSLARLPLKDLMMRASLIRKKEQPPIPDEATAMPNEWETDPNQDVSWTIEGFDTIPLYEDTYADSILY